MNATAHVAWYVQREIERRDAEIEATEERQRLVILSAERRTLLWVADLIEIERRKAGLAALAKRTVMKLAARAA